MTEQKELFGPQYTVPKVGAILRKVISKERLEEARKIFASGDYKTSARILSDLNDKLEGVLRRISNEDTAGRHVGSKTVKRDL